MEERTDVRRRLRPPAVDDGRRDPARGAVVCELANDAQNAGRERFREVDDRHRAHVVRHLAGI
jgi:hypothetical protein